MFELWLQARGVAAATGGDYEGPRIPMGAPTPAIESFNFFNNG
jgi:hypothetical protein